MENNKNKKSVKFQGDMLNFYGFIQVFIFTTNHHLKFILRSYDMFDLSPMRILITAGHEIGVFCARCCGHYSYFFGYSNSTVLKP